MATAGERYEVRTGNIWSYCNRGDVTGLKAALSRGVDVNIVNTVGWTPSHSAAAGGKPNILRILVKAGADLSIADKGGNMPVHQAAKNGHTHALKTLQELGADVTKVRLSQVKGKAARDFISAAYRHKASKGGLLDENCLNPEEDENVASTVGYARKQSKSTAFWGPRRTPISAKIKKKILKDKRKERKLKMQEKRSMIQIIGQEKVDNANKDDQEEQQQEGDGVVEKGRETMVVNELTYIETVQQIKRSKKLKRQQKQGRTKSLSKQTAQGDDDDNQEDDTIITLSNESSDEDETENQFISAGRFAALSMFEDDDSNSD
jgi:hypothetical protein